MEPLAEDPSGQAMAAAIPWLGGKKNVYVRIYCYRWISSLSSSIATRERERGQSLITGPRRRSPRTNRSPQRPRPTKPVHDARTSHSVDARSHEPARTGRGRWWSGRAADGSLGLGVGVEQAWRAAARCRRASVCIKNNYLRVRHTLILFRPPPLNGTMEPVLLFSTFLMQFTGTDLYYYELHYGMCAPLWNCSLSLFS